MTKFKYFAYGSNMLTERLKPRCRSAVRIGVAEAAGWSVEFSKRSSIDNSGKATLIESNCNSFGVLFEIDNTDLLKLDGYEGIGQGYDRNDNFSVNLIGGGTICAKTYLASETENSLKPYDWYLALVIAGGREHNLDQDYVRKFLEVAYKIDCDENRCTRKKAIEAMRKSGVDNYKKLLPDG